MGKARKSHAATMERDHTRVQDSLLPEFISAEVGVFQDLSPEGHRNESILQRV